MIANVQYSSLLKIKLLLWMYCACSSMTHHFLPVVLPHALLVSISQVWPPAFDCICQDSPSSYKRESYGVVANTHLHVCFVLFLFARCSSLAVKFGTASTRYSIVVIVPEGLSCRCVCFVVFCVLLDPCPWWMMGHKFEEVSYIHCSIDVWERDVFPS